MTWTFDLDAPPGQMIRQSGAPDIEATQPLPLVGSPAAPLFATADTVPAVAGVLAHELAWLQAKTAEIRHALYVLCTDAIRRVDEIGEEEAPCPPRPRSPETTYPGTASS
jgi:hypothetical protein